VEARRHTVAFLVSATLLGMMVFQQYL